MRDGKIFIIDTSWWNDDKGNPARPNFNTAKAQGVDAVINKLGQGFDGENIWIDRDFEINMGLELQTKLYRGSYYFLDHAPYHYAAGQAQAWGAKQAKGVYKYLVKSGLYGEIPTAVDTEENAAWGKLTSARILSDIIPMTGAYLETLADLLKFPDLFYYCNRHFESLSKGLERWMLWISHLEGEQYIYPNKAWPLKNCTLLMIEQWGSSMDGRELGFDSGLVDTNRWRGTTSGFYELMKRWNPSSPLLSTPTQEDPIDVTPDPEPPIVVDPTPTTGKSKWVRLGKVLYDGTRIRSSAEMGNWNITLKRLQANREVPVLNEVVDKAGNRWAEIGIDQYIAIRVDGKNYMTFEW